MLHCAYVLTYLVVVNLFVVDDTGNLEIKKEKRRRYFAALFDGDISDILSSL